MSRIFLVTVLVVCSATFGAALRCYGCKVIEDDGSGRIACRNDSATPTADSIVECGGSCITSQTFNLGENPAPRVNEYGCASKQIVSGCYQDFPKRSTNRTMVSVCRCVTDLCNVAGPNNTICEKNPDTSEPCSGTSKSSVAIAGILFIVARALFSLL